jgi:hypothetical protein
MRCDGLDILSAGPYADNAPAHEASHRRGRLDLRKTAPGQGSSPHEQCHPGFVEERAKGKSEGLDELPWQTRVARATGARYGRARLGQRSAILDEFDAATGYERKYAIRLLLGPIRPPAPIGRPRGLTNGPGVQGGAERGWSAANAICAKRMVPFLPELIPTLERHGHLVVSPMRSAHNCWPSVQRRWTGCCPRCVSLAG